jgi:spore germination protein YaaH
VATLVAAVEADHLDGVLLDYEEIHCRPDSFSRFIDALAAELRVRSKQLGIAIPEPCGIAPECERDPYPFELNHLAAVVDVLAVMEYDYVVDGTGPVAPRDWFIRGLRRLRRDIEARHLSKVFVGLPLYGRVSKTVTMAGDNAVLWADVKGWGTGGPTLVEPLRFDGSMLTKVAHFRMAPKKDDGIVFLEDHETLSARLDILQQEGFANVALWRLGGEDPCGWSVLQAWQAGARTGRARVDAACL